MIYLNLIQGLEQKVIFITPCCCFFLLIYPYIPLPGPMKGLFGLNSLSYRKHNITSKKKSTLATHNFFTFENFLSENMVRPITNLHLGLICMNLWQSNLRIYGDFGLLIQNFRSILHATTNIC